MRKRVKPLLLERLTNGPPSTRRALHRELSVGYEPVVIAMRELREAGLVYICGWQGGANVQGQPAPLWTTGNLPDVPRPDYRSVKRSMYRKKLSSKEQIEAIHDVEPRTIRLPGRTIHLSGMKPYKEFE